MSNALLVVFVALAAEVLLLLLGLLAFSWWRNRATRQRDAQAIKTLVARVKQTKAEREALIRKVLTDRMGMSGEALQHTQATLLRAELGLLRGLAAMYHGRDAQAAARLDLDLYAALEPYQALQPGNPIPTVQADSGELEHLRAENQRLSEQLRVTTETMSRMVNEYADMFTAAEPEAQASMADTADAGTTGQRDAAPAESPGPTEKLEEGPVEVVGLDEPEDRGVITAQGPVELAGPEDAATGDSVPEAVFVNAEPELQSGDLDADDEPVKGRAGG